MSHRTALSKRHNEAIAILLAMEAVNLETCLETLSQPRPLYGMEDRSYKLYVGLDVTFKHRANSQS